MSHLTERLVRAIEQAGARVIGEVDGSQSRTPGHALLSVDEEGTARWHCSARSQPPRKGIVALVALAVDPVLGQLGVRGVEAWERVARPYRLRTFTADNHDRDADEAEPWALLGNGRRALLFLHGTFGRAHEVFDLGRETMASLEALYDGRVFAFDHFTLTHDPVQNVEHFLRGLEGGACDVDIVCHSRGGLVARQLALAAPDRVRVDRIVFVGSPNEGTALADPQCFSQFADVYTNLFTDPRLGEALVGVVHLVAALSEDVTDRLPGVVAQRPSSATIERLGRSLPDRNRSFAAASDFTHDSSRPSLVAADLIADGAFASPNDLAVPVASVFSFVPAEHRLSFGAADAVHHFAYFRRPETRHSLLQWLGDR